MPAPVEFLDEPDYGHGEIEDDVGPPRRRWPIAVLVAVALLLAGWAAFRPATGSPHSTARSRPTVARTSADKVAVRPPRSGPPGCPRGVFCDVSRDQVPDLLRAVRRHFPGARTLTTYTVLRTGVSLRGGGLEYRQDAFTLDRGLLVITVRARPSPPPFPSMWVSNRGHAAALLVSVPGFDLDIRFTGIGADPISGQPLVALADEPALTAVA